MDSKASIIISYWIAIAIISSVYIYTFGSDIDIMYGVLIPIGFLVLIGFVLSYAAISQPTKKE